MPNHSSDAKTLVQSIIDKASMKQEVYQKTQEVFTQFKTITEQFVNAHKKTFKKVEAKLSEIKFSRPKKNLQGFRIDGYKSRNIKQKRIKLQAAFRKYGCTRNIKTGSYTLRQTAMR